MEQDIDKQLSGSNLIAGLWKRGDGETFNASAPHTGEALPPAFQAASPADVDEACESARLAFVATRSSPNHVRARLLEAIAGGLEADADRVIDRAALETGLDRTRLSGEVGRTAMQLRVFASIADAGSWRGDAVDPPMPDRTPAPRPELRRTAVPLGPIAVFAASNFPLAFSVAGGDTASALAVGCPVVVKAHESHPGTSELVAAIVARSVAAAGLPAGMFSMLQGDGRAIAPALVSHPAIAGVAFTGSFAGGMAMRELAANREQPIPVFAEMGSQNPVFVLPEALRTASDDIAAGLAGSITMGSGQFCTKPGLVFGVAGPEWSAFGERLASALTAITPGPMLNERMARTYAELSSQHAGAESVEVLGGSGSRKPTSEPGYRVHPFLIRTTLADFRATPELRHEMFGPACLLVTCGDIDALVDVATQLPGQLTATVHRRGGDDGLARRLINELMFVAGRVIVDGYPTGVEVAASMQDGGPFPATTDSRFTSVGADAWARFTRPVCLQNVPAHLLSG